MHISLTLFCSRTVSVFFGTAASESNTGANTEVHHPKESGKRSVKPRRSFAKRRSVDEEALLEEAAVVVQVVEATLEEGEEETLEVGAAVDRAFNEEEVVGEVLALAAEVEVDSVVVVDLLEVDHRADLRVEVSPHQATVLHPDSTVRGKALWFDSGYSFVWHAQQRLNNYSYSKYITREASNISHFEAAET